MLRDPNQGLCIYCNKPLLYVGQEKFCTKTCTISYFKELYKKHKTSCNLDLAPATIGAISELYVVNDLLIKGYEIFRAASPACSCDLIASNNNLLKKIEVRTGSSRDNFYYYNTRNFKADLFAIVIYDVDTRIPEIYYEPPLETVFTVRNLT